MDQIFNGINPCLMPIGFGYLRLLTNNRNEAWDYMFLEVNSEFERLTDLRRENILGKRASEVFHGTLCGSFNWLSYYESVVRSGKTQETVQFIENLGDYYKVTVIPLQGEFFAVVIRASSGEVPIMKTRTDSESILENLETVFSTTHDAILLVEYSGGKFRYIRNNALHQKLTGFSNLSGSTPVELLGEKIGKKLISYYEQCLFTGRPVTYEQKYDFAPGKRVWHTEVTPIAGRDGKSFLLCCSKDITELKAVQGENELLVQRLKSMFSRHSAIMLIIEPFSGRILDANPAACEFYGYSKEELQSLLISDINVLPPDEVKENRLKTYEEQQELFIFPHRLHSGEVRLVEVYSCPISDGKNTLLYSIIFDVTDRETYRNELVQEKEVLLTTLRSIGDGVVTTDRYGVITSLNVAAQEITGWTDNEARGRIFTDVFLLKNEETGEPVENPIQKVLQTGRIVGLANHTVMINRHHQVIPIADSAAPIKAEGGQILGVVMVFRDVRGEKEKSDQIRFLSYHDPLTGLYNRRYIEEMMPMLDEERNLPLSVIMGDVNGLKITNDVFGHETGDALLKHMAQSLKHNCNKNAVIARWGGDEVVVFLPRTGLLAAEEIVQKIKEDNINVDESGLRMSISFGCSVKERPDQQVQAIMRQAEEYMYHQKLLDGKSYRNAIINTLLATLYEKSNETEEHSKRIEKYCHLIGQKLLLPSKDMDDLSLLAILHDIGKVSVNPNILLKDGPLTPAEWEEMKRHTEVGYRIAQTTPELALVADLILSHHERWDGKGYPRGLKQDEIPLACRILAVTDAFDAMTNDRVYRKAMSIEEAIFELERNSGSQFDSTIASLFIETIRDELCLDSRKMATV